jgi:hypothetical protein
MNLDYPIGGYWESVDSFFAAPSHPERFFSVDPDGLDIRSSGEFLEGFVRGDYGSIGDLPEKMKCYAEENSLTLSGAVYVVYVVDEIGTPKPENFLAKVIISMRKGS